MIKDIEIKENFLTEYLRRTKLIMKSSLSGMNKIMSMNKWTLSMIRCKCCEIDKNGLHVIDRKTRKVMTMNKELHPRMLTCCMYIEQRE